MKQKIVKTIAVALILAGIGFIASLFIQGNTEWTDDAQVEQYLSPIAVRVPGYIKEIRFTEHQFVKQGDTLVLIDDCEMRIAVAQAEAALMEARSGRKVMAGSVQTASAGATVYDASISEAEIRIEKLERDYRRFSALLEKKATTPMVVEQYKTELEAARMKLEALRRQRTAALSTVGEVTQRQENAEAAILRAEAALEMAKLNLSYTVITAPCDGWLGRRTIQEGQLVAPGLQLTSIIPATQKWVVANFKETQLARIREGQSVEVCIDALPGQTFHGQVERISSATGSKYSVIPTDNATGNFVKIQQRIPVRITLEEVSEADNARMAAGMMCEVKVKVK